MKRISFDQQVELGVKTLAFEPVSTYANPIGMVCQCVEEASFFKNYKKLVVDINDQYIQNYIYYAARRFAGLYNRITMKNQFKM